MWAPLWLFLVTVAADEPSCLLQSEKLSKLAVDVDQKQLKQDSVKDFPPSAPGYTVLCGPNCRCTSFGGAIPQATDPTDCAENFCPGPNGFIFSFDPSSFSCRCCNNMELQENTGVPWFYYIPGGDVEGDPHITTLDGKHYTLLKQGSFSLWHLSGLETHFPVGKSTQTVPVDWQIFTHYSGHQSFTKGLLLVDKSGGSMRQVLEMTAQDCKWKTRKGNEDWKTVNNAELIFNPDGQAYVTGFNMTKTNGMSGGKFPNRVSFNMNTMHGKSDIATLSVSCRPAHNINLQVAMKRGTDNQFVDGEMKVARKSLSTLQMSTDAEFSMQDKWQELGGSEIAAMYLQQLDADKTSTMVDLSCSTAEESQAKETCAKHLGATVHGSVDDSVIFKDCVFDLCHGAGETQAELAAELLEAMKA